MLGQMQVVEELSKGVRGVVMVHVLKTAPGVPGEHTFSMTAIAGKQRQLADEIIKVAERPAPMPKKTKLRDNENTRSSRQKNGPESRVR